MRLIGINGFKGSGKDTTFQLIKEIEFHAYVVERVGFADKLKIMAAKALGFTDLSDDGCIKIMNECKESWDFSVFTGGQNGDIRFGFNGRQYLQWFGGEARSVFGDTFWIDQILPNPLKISRGPLRGIEAEHDTYTKNVARELTQRYPDTDILCVTDVRYENEAERIIGLGGEVWEIIKHGLESDGHDSEIPLPPHLVTVKLLNDGSIEDLRSLVASTL